MNTPPDDTPRPPTTTAPPAASPEEALRALARPVLESAGPALLVREDGTVVAANAGSRLGAATRLPADLAARIARIAATLRPGRPPRLERLRLPGQMSATAGRLLAPGRARRPRRSDRPARCARARSAAGCRADGAAASLRMSPCYLPRRNWRPEEPSAVEPPIEEGEAPMRTRPRREISARGGTCRPSCGRAACCRSHHTCAGIDGRPGALVLADRWRRPLPRGRPAAGGGARTGRRRSRRRGSLDASDWAALGAPAAHQAATGRGQLQPVGRASRDARR